MPLKLYGLPVSPAMQAVTVTLKELNVPYEIVMVDVLGGENKKPDYLENMHPFGQIPVLVDEDGFKVFESYAMARYIVAKYAPDSGLVPKDLKKNALFEQAMSIEVCDFHPYALGLAAERFLKMMRGVPTSEAAAAEHAKNLEKILQGYERLLSKQKYLAGDELTLADLFHLPLGWIVTEKAGFNGLKATPNVARWWTDISSRSAWKETQKGVEEFMAQMMKNKK